MNNKEVNDFIESMGAIMEMAGLMRDQLIAQGFTRQESVQIVGDFLGKLLTSSMNGGEKK